MQVAQAMMRSEQEHLALMDWIENVRMHFQ